MEEVLFGRDIGVLRLSYKHWLSFLAVVHCSNSSTHNYHWHQRQWSTELGCCHDEGKQSGAGVFILRHFQEE
ncbi:hypothetical protein E2542_SST03374 [Spatholobus suberectus]|nr:hypothetical protein E2542_SST03374 [Spatholobus suberectus]